MNRVSIETVLVECMGLKPGESLVVVTDPPRRAIAEALVAHARELGAETVLMEMTERETHGSEPPAAVAAAMLACEVCVAPTSKSISHTAARKEANARGVRVATMPQITEDMLDRAMAADYKEVQRRSRILADALTAGHEVRITSPEGTDVTMNIEGRSGISDDGDLTQSGSFGNLPAGEGFVAPVEGKSDGTIVFDGSVWPIGMLDAPIVVDIERGRAVGFSGPRGDEWLRTMEPHGDAALAVAELGIGTNDAARLTGNVLEDEKIIGTIHVAFGDNHTFGGTNRVSSHQDGVVLHPTLAIDGTIYLDAGRLLI